MFTTLDDPLAAQGAGQATYACGISGSNIVGYYVDGDSVTHGFLYNGAAYTTLDAPAANTGTNGQSYLGTHACGVYGDNIVGYYPDTNGVYHGFLLSGTTYTILDGPPGSTAAYAEGITKNGVTGSYTDSAGKAHGFLYPYTNNTSTYITFDDPLGVGVTYGTAIDGQNIVGYYIGKVDYGFIYNTGASGAAAFTTLADPLAASGGNLNGTYPTGISGNNIVGWYRDSKYRIRGFIYNGITFYPLNYPGAGESGFQGTYSGGIDGNNIVGSYVDSSSAVHGFLATPAAVVKGSTKAGKYTVLLSASSTGPLEIGAGYATATVSSAGVVRLVGKLADGKGFSAAGALLGGAGQIQFSFHVPLTYGSVTGAPIDAYIGGCLTFAAMSGTSDFSGTLEWVRPAQYQGGYQVAINTNLNAIGSVYTPPGRKHDVLPGFPVESGASIGTLELSDTSGYVLNVSAKLSAANKLIVANRPKGMSIKIVGSTGLFEGKFLYPGETKARDFGGVLYQDKVMGEGFYLGPNGSGTVSLMP